MVGGCAKALGDGRSQTIALAVGDGVIALKTSKYPINQIEEVKRSIYYIHVI